MVPAWASGPETSERTIGIGRGRRVHARPSISDRHFRLVAGHLVAVLGACGVPDPLSVALPGHMAALQGDVGNA
jgi:hypothetical protein